MKNPTVTELKKSGIEVNVTHFRFLEGQVLPVPIRDIRKNGEVSKIKAKGGVTRVELILPDGSMAFGEALCSKNQGFNRREGLNRALGRAIGAKSRMGVKSIDSRFVSYSSQD